MPITTLYIDGSTLNNQGARKGCSYGGYGGYIVFSDGSEKVFSEPLEGDKITNQVSELMALKHALETVIPVVPKDFIYVYTDSMYIVNIYTSWIKKWISADWKKPNGEPVDNVELIQYIYNLVTSNNIKVFYKHVKAHQSAPLDKKSNEYKIWYGNNKADELAVYSANISKDRAKDKNEINSEVKKRVKTVRLKKTS